MLIMPPCHPPTRSKFTIVQVLLMFLEVCKFVTERETHHRQRVAAIYTLAKGGGINDNRKVLNSSSSIQRVCVCTLFSHKYGINPILTNFCQGSGIKE